MPFIVFLVTLPYGVQSLYLLCLCFIGLDVWLSTKPIGRIFVLSVGGGLSAAGGAVFV